MPGRFLLLMVCLALFLLGHSAEARNGTALRHGKGRGSFSQTDLNERPSSSQFSLISEKSLVSDTGEGAGAHLDKNVDYGKACLIVGYHKAGPNGSRIAQGNAYAASVYKHFLTNQYVERSSQGQLNRGSKTAAPDVARVGNIDELVQAIANCPPGSHFVLATHGFGGNGGGFWLGEPEVGENPFTGGFVVSAGSANYNRLVKALAERGISQVTLHSCSIGESAAHGELGDAGLTDPNVRDNFGNRLANDLYRGLDAGNKTPNRTAQPRVTVFSKPIYGSTVAITAQEKDTRRLVFGPDNSEIRRLEEQRLANYPPRPNPPTPVVASPPIPPTPVVSSPPAPPIPVVSSPPAPPAPPARPPTLTSPLVPPVVSNPVASPQPVAGMPPQDGGKDFSNQTPMPVGPLFANLMAPAASNGQGGRKSKSGSSKSGGNGSILATPSLGQTAVVIPKLPQESSLDAFVYRPLVPEPKGGATFEPIQVAPIVPGPALDLRYWNSK